MSTCQAPQTGPISTLSALQTWSSAGVDPITTGWVPLRRRPGGGLPDRPRVLHCHSEYGGYVKTGDLWPQGVASDDIYLQPYWESVDAFIYFGQTLVMIPTPWWINAGHRNGVPVLGTFCLNGLSSSEIALLLDGPPETPTAALPDGTTVPFFVGQLAAVAAGYGFDGWFFNVENWNFSDAQIKQLEQFVKSTTTAMHAAGGYVLWYDALGSGGSSYQNVLDQQNLPFFLACDGIFVNYGWNTAAKSPTDPSLSAALAARHGRSQFDVYTGIDVFQGSSVDKGVYNGFVGQFDTWGTVGACNRAGTSSGLFAASWTFQNGGGELAAYLERDRRLWVGTGGGCEPRGGIAAEIPPRPVPAQLPFFTTFNLGTVPRALCIDGAPQPGSAPYANLSMQDALPSWRFCAVPAPGTLVRFDPDAAFNGGTSLRVTADETARVRLFECTTPVERDLSVVYTVRDPGSALALVLSLGKAPVVLASAAGPGVLGPTQVVGHADGWASRVYLLGDRCAGCTIDGIGLVHAGGGRAANLGDVRILPVAAPAAPGGVGSLAGTPLEACGGGTVSTRLAWTAPADPVEWFDVYCDNGTRSWVGRAYANAYVASVPVGNAESLVFTVQPMSTSGFRQPLADAAAITLAVPPPVVQTAGAVIPPAGAAQPA